MPRQGGRGIARRSKSNPLSDERSDSERILSLLEQGLTYLEEELELHVKTPGNHKEVAAILKALRDLAPNNEGDGGAVDPNRSSWGFESLDD